MLNSDMDSKLVSTVNCKLLRDLSYKQRTAYAKLGKYRKAEELPEIRQIKRYLIVKGLTE